MFTLDEIFNCFSKSMFMYLGELVEYDYTENMFTNPKDERTKAYLTGKMG